MADNDALPIPPAGTRDKKSFELLRVWVAEEQQHVSLRPAVWDDPLAWGIMLADLAQHIANAESQNRRGLDREAFLRQLVKGFRAEIDAPTDEAEGEVVQ